MTTIARIIYGADLDQETALRFSHERNSLSCYIHTACSDGRITARERDQLLDVIHHADLEQLLKVDRNALRFRRITADDLRKVIPVRPNLPPRRKRGDKYSHIIPPKPFNIVETRPWQRDNYLTKLTDNSTMIICDAETTNRLSLIPSLPEISTAAQNDGREPSECSAPEGVPEHHDSEHERNGPTEHEQPYPSGSPPSLSIPIEIRLAEGQSPCSVSITITFTRDGQVIKTHSLQYAAD